MLGNTESHEDDSFSDGLLEGPSYTKPRVWRGIEAPPVLTSGDHAKVEQWRREQSLKRTREVRPELIDAAELTEEDRFMLDARDVVTELDVLGWKPGLEKNMRRALKKAGYRDAQISAEERGTDRCFGPSMLETEFERREGRPSLDPLVRLTVRGRTALSLTDATQAVVAALPKGTDWYGTTREV